MSLRRNTNRQREFDRDAFTLACHVAPNTLTPCFCKVNYNLQNNVLQSLLTRNESFDSNLHIRLENAIRCLPTLVTMCESIASSCSPNSSAINFIWHDVKVNNLPEPHLSLQPSKTQRLAGQGRHKLRMSSAVWTNPTRITKQNITKILNNDHTADGTTNQASDHIPAWSLQVKFCLSCLMEEPSRFDEHASCYRPPEVHQACCNFAWWSQWYKNTKEKITTHGKD